MAARARRREQDIAGRVEEHLSRVTAPALASEVPRELSFLTRSILGAAFLGYFGFTALLYFWGPWTYPMPQGAGKLTGFLVAVHLAFALGYLLGIRGTPARGRWPVSVPMLVLISAGLELILLFPTSAYNTGLWLPRPWVAARDFAAAYTDSLNRRETGTPYVNYVRMFLAPVLALGVCVIMQYAEWQSALADPRPPIATRPGCSPISFRAARRS